MTQRSLFSPDLPQSVPLRRPYFDGPQDGEPDRTARLSGQILDIWRLMRDGQKRTLGEIAWMTGHPEASVSAQLRHLRKRRFGGWTVKKKYVGDGLYRYWMED